MDEAEPVNQHGSLHFDLSSVPGTWPLAYLLLPLEDRDLARRATALNMLTTSEGLPPNWQELFPKVLAALAGESPPTPVNNVLPFTKNKPALAIVPPDATG